MGPSLLFKWEDSPALKHHCGVCERPLSHPGARASCFGTHAEPCHRFHEAMFMRYRAHSCTYCGAINEAHYKRHKGIAEQISNLYESCGKPDWTIVSSESEERGRLNSDSSGEMDRGLTPEDTTASKRERKDAKRLARAASRSRVITQDEIQYVDSVLHSADGVFSSDGDGPRNLEELEEIERHLRYNAHVYNSQENSRGLKKFAKLFDADVDFDAEMERILDTFRVSELIKRNAKNRGLKGKDLKTFQALVLDLKKAVVEDLVLVKKDVLEIRMRRAGYLRYTNKTAYGAVEERYTDVDWKTGEKFTSSSSDSSGIVSPLEQVGAVESTQKENSLPRPPPPTQEPDRRHLESIHKRVNGEDGLEHSVIEPHRAPMLPLLPDLAPLRKPVQLRVVTDTTTGATRLSSDTSQTKANAPKVSALELQLPVAATITGSNEPEQVLAQVSGPVNLLAVDHPVVSQKKKAKKAREAKRKANKGTTQEKLTSKAAAAAAAAADDFHGAEMDEIHTVPTSASTSSVADLKPVGNAQDHELPEESSPNSEDCYPELHSSEDCKQTSEQMLAEPARKWPVTRHGKHMHWLKFTRHFLVDQLTSPVPSSSSECSHGIPCAFESSSIPDCPFHDPYCPCVDPLHDICCLVYPCEELCTSGPYNRLQGERLLAMYENDCRTKGRVMLVDNDLIYYFMLEPNGRKSSLNPEAVPDRLLAEYAKYAGGHQVGPLMKQEHLFERLWHKNGIMKQRISQEDLQHIQRRFEPRGVARMCYCQETVPEESNMPKDIVTCSHSDCKYVYFHKSCVKTLGVDSVTRWFCTSCAEKMRVLARQTLRNLGYKDIPDEKKINGILDMKDFQKNFETLMNVPGGITAGGLSLRTLRIGVL